MAFDTTKISCGDCGWNGIEDDLSMQENFHGAEQGFCPECNSDHIIETEGIRKDGFKSECCNAPVNTFSNGNAYCNKCGEPCFVVKK